MCYGDYLQEQNIEKYRMNLREIKTIKFTTNPTKLKQKKKKKQKKYQMS